MSTRAVLPLILLCGLLVRLPGLLLATAIEMDGVVYARMGEHFAKGAFSEALKGVFPPAYPLVIGLFHLLIPDLELAGRVASLCAGLATIAIVYVFVRNRWGEERALFASLLVALHPYLARYSGQVLSESLCTLLFTATLLLYFRGWIEERGRDLFFSGLLLSLTYLARPEYIVYALPLALLLVLRKRYGHTALFLFSFSCLVLLYIVYMRIDTGVFVVSKKAVLMKTAADQGAVYVMPTPTILRFAVNIPAAAFHFMEALFPPFLLLALVGLKRRDRNLALLSLFLVATHVLSLALLTSSIRRFSIPFVPLALIFAAGGIEVLRAFFQGSLWRRRLWYGGGAVILILCLTQVYVAPNRGRELHKKAGIDLAEKDRGQTVMARLPLVSFYSKGSWVDAGAQLSGLKDCESVTGRMGQKGIRYVVVDEKMAEDLPVAASCINSLEKVSEWSAGEDFVRVYRFRG